MNIFIISIIFRPVEEFFYDFLVAYMYTFDIINISPGDTRYVHMYKELLFYLKSVM